MIHAMLEILAAAEHHGGRGAQAERMGGAVHFFPLVGGAFQAGNAGADFVVENFSAAAGNGFQACIAEAGDRVADAERGNFGDADDFRSGEAVQMDARVLLLQRAEQIFVVIELQIGIQAALQQNSGAAELEHLVNLAANFFEGEDVAFFRAHRAVEGAEGAVFGAEIRVIDVAIDLIGGDARVGLFPPDFVGGHADADDVVGVEEIERFLL